MGTVRGFRKPEPVHGLGFFLFRHKGSFLSQLAHRTLLRLHVQHTGRSLASNSRAKTGDQTLFVLRGAAILVHIREDVAAALKNISFSTPHQHPRPQEPQSRKHIQARNLKKKNGGSSSEITLNPRPYTLHTRFGPPSPGLVNTTPGTGSFHDDTSIPGPTGRGRFRV